MQRWQPGGMQSFTLGEWAWTRRSPRTSTTSCWWSAASTWGAWAPSARLRSSPPQSTWYASLADNAMPHGCSDQLLGAQEALNVVSMGSKCQAEVITSRRALSILQWLAQVLAVHLCRQLMQTCCGTVQQPLSVEHQYNLHCTSQRPAEVTSIWWGAGSRRRSDVAILCGASAQCCTTPL